MATFGSNKAVDLKLANFRDKSPERRREDQGESYRDAPSQPDYTPPAPEGAFGIDPVAQIIQFGSWTLILLAVLGFLVASKDNFPISQSILTYLEIQASLFLMLLGAPLPQWIRSVVVRNGNMFWRKIGGVLPKEIRPIFLCGCMAWVCLPLLLCIHYLIKGLVN